MSSPKQSEGKKVLYIVFCLLNITIKTEREVGQWMNEWLMKKI